jgi:hypothetical protein
MFLKLTSKKIGPFIFYFFLITLARESRLQKIIWVTKEDKVNRNFKSEYKKLMYTNIKK